MPSRSNPNTDTHMAHPIRLRGDLKFMQDDVSNTNKQAPRHIQVQLQYLKDDPIYDTVKPLQVTPNFADREGRTNVRLEMGADETIKDVRDAEGNFSLDEHGFKYVKAPTNFKEWSSQPKIAENYLPELEALLKAELEGCDEIMFYDARLRQAGDEGIRISGLSHNPFARQVHTDNTEKSVIEKIRNLTDMKADYLLRGRHRIINIWRPIKHPVYDCGLAIADGGKLEKGDVIECDRVRQDTGQYWDTMGVIKYRPGYEWYYMSEQDEPDVLLFKNWDSATNVQARYCLHTAFDMPPGTLKPDAPTRESIEVRALVFTYPAHARRPSGEWKLPRPLAHDLHHNRLRRLDEEPSIAGTTRTDIDEGHEIKDALLLLRRNQIQDLEHEMDLHIAEYRGLNRAHEALKTELASAREKCELQECQIQSATEHATDVQTQNADLRSRLRTAHEYMQAHVCYKPGDTYFMGVDSCLDEHSILKNELQHARDQIQQYKDDIQGKIQAARTDAWRDSVKRGIADERAKEAFVLKYYQGEIAKLEAENVALKARNAASEARVDPIVD